MSRNIIDAIITMVTTPPVDVIEDLAGNNRANNAGKGLEELVKNLFAGTVGQSTHIRENVWNSTFSYRGGQNNPPDAMLRGGDAIEIKKIESNGSALAFNSSYPKHKLYRSSQMITNECKNAEKWSEKDMIYVVGVVQANKLTSLCMVYGLDYCASEENYSRLSDRIKACVETTPDVDFQETNELGHVNNVDPLKLTYLRVRPMWGIKNPWSVFSYVYSRNPDKQFNFMCIINDEKWNSLAGKESLIALSNKNSLMIKSVKIKNPDRPEQLVGAKLITFDY